MSVGFAPICVMVVTAPLPSVEMRVVVTMEGVLVVVLPSLLVVVISIVLAKVVL